jgi:hypothetical protein
MDRTRNTLPGHQVAAGVDHDEPSAMEGRALTRNAISATLHCLTGCAIGEVLGMVIGTALCWSPLETVAFVVTVPVNRWLIARGKGHAVVHEYHHFDHPSAAELPEHGGAHVGHHGQPGSTRPGATRGSSAPTGGGLASVERWQGRRSPCGGPRPRTASRS